MRHIDLTAEQRQHLQTTYQTSPDHRERQRAQALLLSHRGWKLAQIADLFEVDRDTISQWFDRWQGQQPCDGPPLRDAARSGRPPHLTPPEKKA